MNNFNGIGRWVSDGELRFSQSGKAVYKNTLAINRVYGEGADFIEVVAFEKKAENSANFTKKGSLVGISGSLKQEQWEKDGQKRSKIVVLANNVEFLDGKKSDNNTTPVDDYLNDFEAVDDSDIPF